MDMSSDLLVVEFPLHGTCITPNTPGTKIPSHGTTLFGESHAIDLVMIDGAGKSKKAYDRSLLEYLIKGLVLEHFYGWGQSVYAPLDGEVLELKNDVPERKLVRLHKDLGYMLEVTKAFKEGLAPMEAVSGNYVLIKHSETVYVLLAHLKEGSIRVKKGDRIVKNQIIGELGHSGNSMMPHLHMQFMDSPYYHRASGLPFVFRAFEKKDRDGWKKVSMALPTAKDIIRDILSY